MSFDAGSPHWSFDVDAYTGPGLLIQDFEVEGPLEEWPPPSRAHLLGDVDPADGTLTDIREILLSTLRRAFRRRIRVEHFFNAYKDRLKMEVVAGGKGLHRTIREGSINRPALALTGFFIFGTAIIVMYWCTRWGVSDGLGGIMGAGTGVCGVSA